MIEIKWQPVMLVVDKRVECKCGALAIFITGNNVDDDEMAYNTLNDVDVWCQECFKKSQDEDE